MFQEKSIQKMMFDVNNQTIKPFQTLDRLWATATNSQPSNFSQHKTC